MTRYGIVNKDTGKVENVVVWENEEWLPPKDKIIVRHDRIDTNDKYDFASQSFVKWNCKSIHKIDVKSSHALVDAEGKIRNIIIRDDSDWIVPKNHHVVYHEASGNLKTW